MEAVQGTSRILNGRYELLEKIGSGGMAGVWKGQDLVLGRLVAVKVLHAGFTGDETFLGKFRKEAHSVANLAHPNIVTVHDIGQDGDSHYIVMELVEGRNLKEVIRSQAGGRPIPVQRALDLSVQICAGLGYAHRAGLVHCDVKPQNVLVTPDERVKITDFGIARAMSEATSQQKEQVWGTPQYFSPEQAMGQPATPSSDVYSLGIILFELLTGELPFSAETQTAIALKHVHEPPPRISTLNPSLPLQLEEIVDKVLSKEPSNRYRTAGQFGRILSSYRARGAEDTNTMYQAPIAGGTARQQRRTLDMNSDELHQQMTGAILPQSTPSERIAPVEQPAPSPPDLQPVLDNQPDWIAIALGFVAFFALIGLIPLWYLVAVQWGVF